MRTIEVFIPAVDLQDVKATLVHILERYVARARIHIDAEWHLVRSIQRTPMILLISGFLALITAIMVRSRSRGS